MRKLSELFITDLKYSRLKAILSRCIKDDTLCLEIRENYINIYYRGGNIFKIVPSNNDYKIIFDLNYCDEYKEIISDIFPNDYNEWVKNIPIIKSEMDAFLYKHPKLEREYQQLVMRENNNSSIANDTDYYIVDIEYANSEIGSRFDLLGIKWI